MQELRFVQVDVFTERVFGGNPLAVVFEAAGLSDAEMQAIAREMNCSETTFLLPPTRPDCAARVRIFTPARELPFAGHPTIGTAWVLATEKLLPPNSLRFNLEEGIGPVEVTLEGEPARPSFLWMRHGEARFGPELIKRAGFARALGLAESDLLAGAPICTGSTGNTFLYIPLRDREVVDRARLDVPALLAAQGEGPNVGVFVFAPDPDPKAGRRRTRACSRRTRRAFPRIRPPARRAGRSAPIWSSAGWSTPADTVDIVSEQGTRMGRPSFIRIRVGMTRRARQRDPGGRQRGARDRGPAAGALTPCTSPSSSRSPTPRGATR